jgi:hypothetical protein
MDGFLAQFTAIFEIDTQSKILCFDIGNGALTRTTIKVKTQSIGVAVIELQRALPGRGGIDAGVRPGKRIYNAPIPSTPGVRSVPSHPVQIQSCPAVFCAPLLGVGPVEHDPGHLGVIPDIPVGDHDLLLVAVVKVESTQRISAAVRCGGQGRGGNVYRDALGAAVIKDQLRGSQADQLLIAGQEEGDILTGGSRRHGDRGRGHKICVWHIVVHHVPSAGIKTRRIDLPIGRDFLPDLVGGVEMDLHRVVIADIHGLDVIPGNQCPA